MLIELQWGLQGEGSECLGFDDCYSTDHDFGPGFCLWLTKSDYDEIGQKLQADYDSLPKNGEGFQFAIRLQKE